MAITERWPFQKGATTTGINGTAIACTRSTTGTIRNASGYLEDVAINTPRIDYDASGNCLGLLIEETMVEQSDVDQIVINGTGWTTTFCGHTADASPDPYGTAGEADKISKESIGNLLIWGSPTVTASAIHTVSVFVRNDSTNVGNQPWVQLSPNAFTGLTGGCWYNPATGAEGTQTWTNLINSGVETYADGWYRIWVSYTHTTDVSGNYYIRLVNGDGNVNGTGLTDGDGFFVWGAMLEANDIKAAPSSFYNGVSRSADNIDVTDVSLFPSDYLALPNSYYVEFSWLGLDDSNYCGCVMNGATSSINLGFETASRLRAQYTSSTAGTVTSVGNILENGGVNRAAVSIASNDMSMSLNGEAVVQDTTVNQDTPTSVSSLVLGRNYDDSLELNGHLRDLIFYYGEDIDDATLVTMSTNGVDYSTAFGGTVAGDGGLMWPPRANDPRWTQLLTDSGISQSGNFMDDVKAALIALSGASGGSLDDLWKKTLAANAVTDISEPYLY